MISNIANDAAYDAIVGWMDNCKAQYDVYNEDGEFYAQDTEYFNKVMENFAKTRNVDVLINDVTLQDTYVREFYAPIVNDLYSTYYNGEWE